MAFPASGATPTAETVISASGPLTVGAGNVKAIIRGCITVLAGAAGNLTIRVRQGTTTAGPLLATAQDFGTAAGDAANIAFEVEDQSNFLNSPAGGQYCITLQVATAGTYVGGSWGVETYGG